MSWRHSNVNLLIGVISTTGPSPASLRDIELVHYMSFPRAQNVLPAPLGVEQKEMNGLVAALALKACKVATGAASSGHPRWLQPWWLCREFRAPVATVGPTLDAWLLSKRDERLLLI